MKINNAIIDKLAKLSSLIIDESKKESLCKELEEIVGFVENLNEIDVSSVDATFTPIKGGQPLREDVSNKIEGMAENIMINAPKTQDNYFIVPTIIE